MFKVIIKYVHYNNLHIQDINQIILAKEIAFGSFHGIKDVIAVEVYNQTNNNLVYSIVEQESYTIGISGRHQGAIDTFPSTTDRQAAEDHKKILENLYKKLKNIEITMKIKTNIIYSDD